MATPTPTVVAPEAVPAPQPQALPAYFTQLFGWILNGLLFVVMLALAVKLTARVVGAVVRLKK